MKKLKPQHRQAIRALLSQPSIDAAAAAVGVTERTLYNWLKEPEFKTALEDAEAEMLASISRQMATASAEALLVLRRVLRDEEATVSKKIVAAKAVLQFTPSFRLLGSIEQKLQELGASE